MKIAIALLLAAVVAAGLHWGTFAVGGSDSYCYVHQAEAWSAGDLHTVEPLALEAPWPDAPLSFTPTGHAPSPLLRGAIVPICPAGLSLVMAPFMAADRLLAGAGGASNAPRRAMATFLVVPLFGALLVWSTFLLGGRFSPCAGLAAAVVVAASPIVLFQLMQPMSDVPAAALWVFAAACATGSGRRAALWAGLATSAAILMRPNLLPLGVTIGVALLVRPSRPPRERFGHAATFAAASAVGCLVVAAIQQQFYGSPLRSGYGSLDSLFSVANIGPNAARYFSWMWESHSPAWLLALAAPLLLAGWPSGLLLALAAVNVACYLPYVVFNDWWYLRFMLPAVVMVLVLAVAVADSLLRRVMRQPLAAHLALVVLTIPLVALFVREAKVRSVFDLWRLESRYVRAGAYVNARLPGNALIITSWESGSVRFYSNRRTLAWDVLDPQWLDRAIQYSRDRGLQPYLLFERWEEPLFRGRFPASTVGALDWPPAAEIAGQVRIYRPEDREAYRSGRATPTDYAR